LIECRIRPAIFRILKAVVLGCRCRCIPPFQ
jgi:hypothetical protein